jgi:hypothetical protein
MLILRVDYTDTFSTHSTWHSQSGFTYLLFFLVSSRILHGIGALDPLLLAYNAFCFVVVFDFPVDFFFWCFVSLRVNDGCMLHVAGAF